MWQITDQVPLIFLLYLHKFFPDCSWETFEESLGSDHLPIVIKLTDSQSEHEATDDRTRHFNYDRADWVMLNGLLMAYETGTLESDDIDEFYSNFSRAIIEVANKSIPKKKPFKVSHKTGHVWWNDSCEQAAKNKQIRFKARLQNKTEYNHLEMKKVNITCNSYCSSKKDILV